MKHLHNKYTLHSKKGPISIEKIGFVFAFGSLLFDGTYGSLAKGLTNFLSPISLLVFSEGLTALFVILTLGLIPLIKQLSKMPPKELLLGLVIGILSSGIAPLLWFTGLKQTTAVNAAMLSSCELLFMLMYGRILLKESINKMQAIGALVVMSGIGVIVFNSSSDALSVHIGDFLILIAGGVFSFGTILYKKYLRNVHPEVALFVRNASGIFVMSVFGVFFGTSLYPNMSGFPLQSLSLLIAFAFFSRFLNITFLYAALDRLPATNVALVQNAAPLTGMLFAFLILHESILPYHIVGMLFIIFGLVVENVSAVSALSISRKILRFDFSSLHST